MLPTEIIEQERIIFRRVAQSNKLEMIHIDTLCDQAVIGNELLAALKAFTIQAKKYHDDCGHDIPGAAARCDSICECLPAALAVIAKVTK